MHLPICYCENFRNGLTAANNGEEACARHEVNGLSGTQTWCASPERPHIPHVDDGCSSDTFRCMVVYTPPIFPSCQCDKYDNDAIASTAVVGGLCQKYLREEGQRICRPRSSAAL